MWAIKGLSHLGDLMILPKISVQDVVHERAHCHDEVANHQVPIAAAF